MHLGFRHTLWTVWPPSRCVASPSLYYFPFVNWQFWFLLQCVDNMVFMKTFLLGLAYGRYTVKISSPFFFFLSFFFLFSRPTQGMIIAVTLFLFFFKLIIDLLKGWFRHRQWWLPPRLLAQYWWKWSAWRLQKGCAGQWVACGSSFGIDPKS